MKKIFGKKKIVKDDAFHEFDSKKLIVKESHDTITYNNFLSEEIIEILTQRIKEELDLQDLSLHDDTHIKNLFHTLIHKIANDEKLFLSQKQEDFYADYLIHDMLGFGPLETLLKDDKITDIFVNGPFDVLIEKEGQIQKTPLYFRDEKHLLQIAQRIANRMGRRVDASKPMVDARLDDDSRVNIILPPLSLSGIVLSIRKFRKSGISLDKMVEKGSLSPKIQEFLKLLIQSRLNILISGGTGAGKTTLMNALSAYISPNERIITIEDTAELRLMQPHVIRLEARPPNLESQGEITIRDLVRNALRMRPDRIIIGEVRGPEVIDMLQALNTGHQGSMSTIHANEPKEALARLENMAYLAGLSSQSFVLKDLIKGAIDIIVHLERMQDGVRRVTAISEILSTDDQHILIQDLFRLNIQEGSYIQLCDRPAFLVKAEKMKIEAEVNCADEILNLLSLTLPK
ncbi:MAG: CpaF family protein [Alphaproteobacteria bacterium]|nr:CpaF family protein [Alphaproteobacteria bacterium]